MIMKQITLIAFLMAFVCIVKGQTGGVIVEPGTTVTQEQGSVLDITNGHLLLKDDLNNSPSFLQKGTVSYTTAGDSQVEQYLVKDEWHIVSSPVQDEVNGAYMWIYFYNYDESNNQFVYMNLPVNQPLNPGQGYFAWAYTTDPNGQWPPSPDFVMLNGTLNNSDINLTLSVTDSSPKSGWNLVGNPFPVGLDWNGNSDWNLTNLDASIWIWDPAAGNYKTWNYNSGGTLQSGEIAATQGFWVHADDTTGSVATSMTIPASQRVHTSNVFYKNSQPVIPNQLKLKVQGGDERNDETIIGFHSNASIWPDSQLDALYLPGKDYAPSLCVFFNDYKYAMKQFPDYEIYHSVPLLFRAPVDGIYTITADWIESFPADLEISIEDKKENIRHNLKTDNTYTFAAQFNDEKDRFVIHFGNNTSTDEFIDNSMINIFSYDKKILVEILNENFEDGHCIIFDLSGKKVAEDNIVQGINVVETLLNKGFYIVTVQSNTCFKAKKVFIN
jgi:hypothetical protein